MASSPIFFNFGYAGRNNFKKESPPDRRILHVSTVIGGVGGVLSVCRFPWLACFARGWCGVVAMGFVPSGSAT